MPAMDPATTVTALPAPSAARQPWIDGLRLVTCLAVVMLHVAGTLLGRSPVQQAPAWWAGSVWMALSAWCVPVFVMVSGAVNLGRAGTGDAAAFYRRRRPFFLRLAFWTVFYWAVTYWTLHAWTTGEFTVADAAYGLYRGIPYYHLWFLYMLAGLYMITPMLGPYLADRVRRLRLRAIAGIIVLAFVVTLLRDVFFPQVVHSVVTLFLPFTAYYLLGYERVRRPLRDEGVGGPLCLFGVAAAGLCVAGHGPAVAGIPTGWLYGAFSPFVAAMAVSVFVLARRLGAAVDRSLHGARGAFTGSLAALAFAIYVLHPLTLLAMDRAGFPWMTMPPLAGVPLIACVAFLLTGIVSLVLIHLPGVKRLFG